MFCSFCLVWHIFSNQIYPENLNQCLPLLSCGHHSTYLCLSLWWGDTCTACQSHSSYRRLSEVITVTSMFTVKIKWDVYTISAEEGKQVCDNMNKICELLMISILMTNHHDNQFILSPEIAHWCRETGIHEKCILKSEKCSENEITWQSTRLFQGMDGYKSQGRENGAEIYEVARSHPLEGISTLLEPHAVKLVFKFNI